jgi:hypothetical protein
MQLKFALALQFLARTNTQSSLALKVTYISDLHKWTDPQVILILPNPENFTLPLYARTGAISLSLGTQPANIGEKANPDLRNSILDALKTAYSFDNPCKPKGNANFWVFTKAPDELSIIGIKGISISTESANWNNNREIYNFLVNSVSGAAVWKSGREQKNAKKDECSFLPKEISYRSIVSRTRSMLARLIAGSP